MSTSQNCIPTVPDCDQHPLCASCFLVSSYSWKLSGWDSAKCKVLESQKMVGYSRELFMGSWEGEGIHLTDCCFQSCWPCTFLWISLHLLKPTSHKTCQHWILVTDSPQLVQYNRSTYWIVTRFFQHAFQVLKHRLFSQPPRVVLEQP